MIWELGGSPKKKNSGTQDPIFISIPESKYIYIHYKQAIWKKKSNFMFKIRLSISPCSAI